MLTITSTVVTETVLATPDAIAGHVLAEHRRRAAAAPFHPGDVVDLVERRVTPGQYLAGDVAVVMLCDPDTNTLTTLLGMHADGFPIQVLVETAQIRLRPPAD